MSLQDHHRDTFRRMSLRHRMILAFLTEDDDPENCDGLDAFYMVADDVVEPGDWRSIAYGFATDAADQLVADVGRTAAIEQMEKFILISLNNVDRINRIRP